MADKHVTTPETTQRAIQRAIQVPGASVRSVARLLGVGVNTVTKYSSPPYFYRQPRPTNEPAESDA